MKKQTKVTPKSIRRSVAVPARLIAEVMQVASPEASKNWNRLVVTALEEYAAARKRIQFDEAMAAMASDPAIQTETKSINRAFRRADRDGLK